MRFLKWLAGALLLMAAGKLLWLRDPLPAIPTSAELSAAASAYDAEITRDNFGVPHVYGKRDADVAFGIAYAHAEDDYETIQEVIAATRGRLARYRGADAAPTDYIVSLLGVWETVDQRYENDIPEDVRLLAEAYATGLNLYASQHRGETWKGLAPFTGKDVIAGFVFKTPLFYGLDETLLELFDEERTSQLALDPDKDRKAFLISPKRFELGSNAIAVAAHRSGDNTTRLLINSHQPMTGPVAWYTGPVAWYEAQLKSEESLDITGGLFPGTPLILNGFNRHLGWANTVNKPDLVDVYRLEVNPENSNQYKLDGVWPDFDVSTATIAVKLAGPLVYTSHQTVLRSEHGPVIRAEHGTYAIRYAGMGEVRQLGQYYRLNQARTLNEFMSAMEMNALPSINYVYADKAGNVGFIHNGQYPERADGWVWSQDLPGNRSDLIWRTYRPYADVPKLINPDSGLVFNANNSPFSATDGKDNLKPDDFPDSMGLQTNQTDRALRLIELTNGQSPISAAGLLALKFDTGLANDSVGEAIIQNVLSQDWSTSPRLSEAATHLEQWDRMHDIENRHAAIGMLTVRPAVTEPLTGIPAPEPSESFRVAARMLYENYGRIDPLYGDVNRLVRGDISLPVSGAPDVLRAIYPAGVRDDGKLHAIAGDTWIGLVEWDADGNQSARVIHQYGSATLDSASDHYADQSPLFAREDWRNALIEKADVIANATRQCRPAE